jgi:streptogramin lyase
MKAISKLGSVLVWVCVSTICAHADLLVLQRRQLHLHNEASGELSGSVTLPISNPIVETGEAMAVGPDGNIYVVGNSLGDGVIVRFDGRTGAFLDTFVSDNQTALTIPTSAKFGPDGDLYVTSMQYLGTGGGVFRYNGKTGVEKTNLMAYGAGGVTAPMDLVFAADGNVYMSDGNVGVVRFKADTGESLGVFAPPTEGSHSGLRLAIGEDGKLYWLSGSVRRYDLSSGAMLGTFVDGAAAGLDNPVAMTFGPDGDLYVAEGTTLNVKRFDGKTGASKGIFVVGSPSQNASQTALAFSGPRLKISQTATGRALKWPNTFGNFTLQSSDKLGASAQWQTAGAGATTVGGEMSVALPAGGGSLYFRLQK